MRQQTRFGLVLSKASSFKLWRGALIALSFFVVASAAYYSFMNTNQSEVNAINSDGFACDGSVYQTRWSSGVGAYLYNINRSVSPYTSTVISGPLLGTAASPTTALNALAYDSTTGYLHAWQVGTKNFLTINNTGAIISTVTVSSLPSPLTLQGGTTDEDGTFYAIADGLNVFSYYKLDPADPANTMVNVPLTVLDPSVERGAVGDIVLDPSDPNIIYVSTGISAGSPNALLNKIDLAAGTYELVGPLTVSGSATTATQSSMYADIDGTIYGYSGTGRFYYIDKGTGTVTLLSNADTAGTADGANCSFSHNKVDTILSATNVTKVTDTQYRVQYTVGVKNMTGDGTADPNVQLTNNLSQVFSAGNPTLSIYAAPSVMSGTCTTNTSFNGTSDFRLLSGSDTLTDGSSCMLTFTVTVTYPSLANVQTTPQNSSVYASASNVQNNGYTFTADGDPVPPLSMVASDTSDDATGFPATVNGDDSTPTPVLLPVDPSVKGYKSVVFSDQNSNSTLNGGDKLTYTVTYQNTGLGDATNFQITDSLPANTTLDSGSLTVSTTGTGQTGSANSSFNGSSDTNLLSSAVALKAGATITASFTVTVQSGFTGSITNQATATGSNISDTKTDNVDNSSTGDCAAPSGVTVPGSSISQSCTTGVDPTTATVVANDPSVKGYKSVVFSDQNSNSTLNGGDKLTYTVTYQNTGLGDATNFQITDSLPANTTLDSGSLTVSTTGTGQTGSANSSFNGSSDTNLLSSAVALKAGATITASFTVTVQSGFTGSITNQATATGSNISDTKTDNVDNSSTGDCAAPSGVTVPGSSISQSCTTGVDPTTATVVANDPSVKGYKSVVFSDQNSNSTLNGGDKLTYTVTYQNTGLGDATNFQITDSLPANTTLDSGSLTVSTTGTGQTGSANSSFNGSSDTNLLSSAVALKAGATITASFTVTVQSGFTGSITNQATATGSNISDTKTDNVDNSSTGDCAAPSGVTVPGSSISQSCTTGVDPTTATVVANDPSVKGYKSVVFSDQNSNSTLNGGDKLTYTVTYQNTGLGDATNFQITDSLPANTTLDSGSLTVSTTGTGQTGSANSSFNGSSDTNLLSSAVALKAGATITASFTVTVQSGFTGSITNQATATGSNISDTKTDNVDNSSTGDCAAPSGVTVPGSSISQSCTTGVDPTTATVVANDPSVKGYKSVVFSDQNSNSTLNGGDKLTYTVTYQNTGLGDATNFQITDSLPANTTLDSGSLTVSTTGTGQTGSANSSFNGSSDTNLLSSAVALKAGATITASFTVTVQSGFTGSITNQATATGSNISDTKTDNVDNSSTGDCAAPSGVTVPGSSISQSCTTGVDPTTATVVANDPSVKGYKSVVFSDQNSNSTLNGGDKLTYTVTYQNTGLGDATNFQITDSLPANTTLDSGSLTVSTTGTGQTGSANSSFNGSSDTNLLSSAVALKAGATITASFTVTVQSGFTGSITNQATATGSNISDTKTDNVDNSSTGDCAAPSGVTVPGSSISQSCTTGVDPTTATVVANGNPVDPPSGYKTYDADGLPVLVWKMVWINDANSGPVLTKIVDPLEEEAPYIDGSVSCEARGASTTQKCEYDAATNSIVWQGIMGDDEGATTEDEADNEVVITLKVSVPDDIDEVENQGQAFWDENGDDNLDDDDPNIKNNLPVKTANANHVDDSTAPTVFKRDTTTTDTTPTEELAETGDQQTLPLVAGGIMLVLGTVAMFIRKRVFCDRA